MDEDLCQLSDDEIILRILNDEENVYEILIDRYRNFAFGIILKRVPRNQAEDVAQDVFVRAYHSLSSYKGKDAFKQWLATIAVRTCFDYLRQRYRSSEHVRTGVGPA